MNELNTHCTEVKPAAQFFVHAPLIGVATDLHGLLQGQSDNALAPLARHSPSQPFHDAHVRCTVGDAQTFIRMIHMKQRDAFGYQWLIPFPAQ